MINNNKSDNSLIKRKKLIELLKENGISRINKEAIKEIDLTIQEDIKKLSRRLAQLLLIKGKKTLEKEDILSLNNKKDYPEI